MLLRLRMLNQIYFFFRSTKSPENQPSEMHFKKAQNQQKTQDPFHNVSTVSAGEKVQTKTIPIDCGEGRILSLS